MRSASAARPATREPHAPSPPLSPSWSRSRPPPAYTLDELRAQRGLEQSHRRCDADEDARLGAQHDAGLPIDEIARTRTQRHGDPLAARQARAQPKRPERNGGRRSTHQASSYAASHGDDGFVFPLGYRYQPIGHGLRLRRSPLPPTSLFRRRLQGQPVARLRARPRNATATKVAPAALTLRVRSVVTLSGSTALGLECADLTDVEARRRVRIPAPPSSR